MPKSPTFVCHRCEEKARAKAEAEGLQRSDSRPGYSQSGAMKPIGSFSLGFPTSAKDFQIIYKLCAKHEKKHKDAKRKLAERRSEGEPGRKGMWDILSSHDKGRKQKTEKKDAKGEGKEKSPKESAAARSQGKGKERKAKKADAAEEPGKVE